MTHDAALATVCQTIALSDPAGIRFAKIFRATFDQLYDGQRTGRYRWDQLYKTEKTHFGTLLEINLRREFHDVIYDGTLLDYQIAGHEVDCKYSHKPGQWMIPPEARGQLLLVCTASDAAGTWSAGVVRAAPEMLRAGVNRDGKTGLSKTGTDSVSWLAHQAALPPNVLLNITGEVAARIFAPVSGQQRINQLFRDVLNQRIGRNTVATVAQQDDYMKRVRSNGGARSHLRAEGILVLGGDYAAHRKVAADLGATVPQPGELVSIRVCPAEMGTGSTVLLDGVNWRLALPGEGCPAAPELPKVNARGPVG